MRLDPYDIKVLPVHIVGISASVALFIGALYLSSTPPGVVSYNETPYTLRDGTRCTILRGSGETHIVCNFTDYTKQP